MINQAIQALHLALWILGSFRSVQALMRTAAARSMESEDWEAAIFKTSSGVVGTLTATTAAFPGEPESIRLYGTLGSVHLAAGVLE
jgi:predicted dehydrogenase